MFRTLALIGLAVFLAPSVMLAQDVPASIVAGQRVRIHRQGNKSLTGTFISADSAHLTIGRDPTDTLRVPRSAITSVDRSVGRKSLAGKGALYGALFGLVGGVTVSAIECEEGLFSQGACISGVGLVSTVLGAATGAIVGAFLHTDRWAPAALPTVAYLPASPDGPRLTLGLHLRF